jgi:hypothetical protein
MSYDGFDAGIYGDDELMLSAELEPIPSLKTYTTQVAALPPRNKLLAMAAELGRQAAEVQDKHRLAEEAQVLSQLTSCRVISFRSLELPQRLHTACPAYQSIVMPIGFGIVMMHLAIASVLQKMHIELSMELLLRRLYTMHKL